MRKLVPLTVGILLALPACSPRPLPFPTELESSVVGVWAGENWGGSGICIHSADGFSYVLTAKHVLMGAERAGLKTTHVLRWDAVNKQWHAAKHEIVDERRNPFQDMALLKVIGEIPVAPLAESTPQVYDPIWVLGATQWDAMVPQDGRVVGVVGANPRPPAVPEIQEKWEGDLIVNAVVIPGYSGSGVVKWCADHSRWEVCGIACWATARGQHFHGVNGVEPVVPELSWIWVMVSVLGESLVDQPPASE